MTDFIDVVEHNPIVFVKAIAEKLTEGYVVQNTIAGFPTFGAGVNFVRLFKGEPRSGVILPEGFTGMIEHYEPMPFLLLLESAVLAGYRFKDGGAHYINERSFKSVEMELVKEDAKTKTTAKKATAKKELKAEPTIDELKGDE
jgi:hypothetical protein